VRFFPELEKVVAAVVQKKESSRPRSDTRLGAAPPSSAKLKRASRNAPRSAGLRTTGSEKTTKYGPIVR